MKPHRTIGIDFGTSTSLVAEGASHQMTSILPIGRLTRAMPSLVGISNAELVAGEDAQDLTLDLVARSVKRAITRDWDTVPLDADKTRTLRADDAIIAVLREVRLRASRSLTLSEGSIRLGCPAMWDGAQRNRLLNLAGEAGIPVADQTLVDEPVAAGIAWVTHRVHDRMEELNGRLLVFDMGGGTLDVALLDVEASPGHTPEISVLASAGVDNAGDHLDTAIKGDLVSMLQNYGIDASDDGDPALAAVVLREARSAKEMLSKVLEVVVAPRYPGIRVPLLKYSREQLEVAFGGQLNDAERIVWATVRAAQLTHEEGNDPVAARKRSPEQLAKEVTYVLLAGGMSRIPAVMSRLSAMFPSAQIYDNAGVGPDESIVAGLADAAGYDRVSLHRPAFDFVLEWPGQPSRVLYEAYTPLYQWWEAMTRFSLYYEATVASIELPGAGAGLLRIRSSAGEDVDLSIDGVTARGLIVQFGRGNIRLVIYPNGRVFVTDGNGRQQALRVARWPVLRGSDHAALIARRIAGQPKPLPELPLIHQTY